MATENKQDQELNTFGFTTSKLRNGLITSIIALLVGAIIVLARQNAKQQKQIVETQDRLYKQMIEEVRRQVTPSVDRVYEATLRVDSAATKVDSLLSGINQRKEIKR